MSRAARHHVIPEAKVLRSVLATLRALGIPCWRNNVGAASYGSIASPRFVRFGEPGAPDVLGFLPRCFGPRAGVFLGVEVKRPGNRPTPAQIAWLRAINVAGGVAFWADSAMAVEYVVRMIREDHRIRVDLKEDGSMDLTDEDLPPDAPARGVAGSIPVIDDETT